MSDSIKLIGESAFCNCTSLEEIIDISKNIEEIDDHAFTGCKKLRKIPGYTEESDFEPTIERIGIEAFNGCVGLKNINIDKITFIDKRGFQNCAFTEINLPVNLFLNLNAKALSTL